MRIAVIVASGLVLSVCAALAACGSSSTTPSGFSGTGDDNGEGDDAAGGDAGTGVGVTGGFGGSTGGFAKGGGGPMSEDSGVDAGPPLVYAHTDDTLYSVDPTTNQATLVGQFSTSDVITDLAVNGNGDVYVNSEYFIFKAALPATPPGAVTLTKIATIAGTNRFFALAFAPVGAIDDSIEALIGGDINGMLWAIDQNTGETTQLGNFGLDPQTAGNTMELSGDLLFYTDANGNPTGLATIRSCPTGTTNCGGDYLAGVDMAALKKAYSSKTPATTLLSGVYGSPGTGKLGPGTGFWEVFGLGAWNATVYGFTRHNSAQDSQLITIDTNSGVGSATSQTFAFTNGWSGAGVTTKVQVTVKAPPPVY